ncbi:hypothetical protein KVT40_008037 [Elsinoe batatas]|uniref:Serine hydrolase domain-containing protein n=1 Tax=Elsinoe batatas TaxID=2601811 RepID=A0A8K0KW32_9PEZI|nr:hypothetical protein KVT40_008037 [Elsinoe batatas]
MKFLCLHGMGTNSEIHEAQLAPIIAQLDPSFEFIYVDGLTTCRPASGVSGLFEGPFYCYYDKPTVETLESAYTLIKEVIEDEGPFHGIFGFSQGGALAASLLLHHQKAAPHEPDLFNMAVFTCASLPFDIRSDQQSPLYNVVVNPLSGSIQVKGFSDTDIIEPVEVNGFISPPAPGDIILRRYHPDRENARIRIPTVHIMGQDDPFLDQGRLLVELCGEMKSVVVHQKGHELPRDRLTGKKIVSAIEATLAQAMSLF